MRRNDWSGMLSTSLSDSLGIARICACAACLVVLTVAAPALATPFHAINSASACATCHVEPVGWNNPESIWDRDCTLDCQGCHVSPTGGGLRTPMGRFYGRQNLPTWGARPADFADPLRFAREGEPTEGRYSLFGGFDGWWGGDVDHTTIEDRLGNIDPDPVWLSGFDIRSMVVVPTSQTDSRDVAAFPMQMQGYLAVHPIENLTAYLDLGIQGSADRYESSGFDPHEQIWLRELFVMVHDLPGNTYVRAGRFAPPFGWRLPDHTAFTRAGLDFDQFRQVYGGELGFAPNEWWANVAGYYQGIDAWPGEEGLPVGGGYTGQGGFRGLGYTIGATAHVFAGQDGYSEKAGGLMGGLNLDPIAYLGELDVSRIEPGGDLDGATRLTALHEIQAYDLLRGFRPRLRYEWIDGNVLYRDDHMHRIGVGAEWFPVHYMSVDLGYRAQLGPGQDPKSEVLLMLHAQY